MKRLSLLSILILAITFSSFSQEAAATKKTETTKKAENKKQPEITFEKTTIDYGTITQGDDGNREFVYKNTGKSPLILTNVKSSCGCTIPSWSKTPLKKKKADKIKVKYNTHRVGNFQKTVTIFSNAKNSPVRLTIKGKVVKKEETKTNPVQQKSLLNN